MHSFANLKNLFKNIFFSLRHAFKVSPAARTAMIFIAIILGITPVLSSKALGILVDMLVNNVSNNSAEYGAVFLLLGIYAFINIVPNILYGINHYLGRSAFLRFEEYLNLYTLKKRADIDIANHEDSKFQDLLKRAFNNGHWPIMHVLEQSYGQIRNISFILVGSVLALAIDWKIYLIVIVFSLPQFFLEIKLGATVWGIWSENSRDSRMMGHLENLFLEKTSIIESKLFSNISLFLTKIKNILFAFNTKQIKAEKKRMLLKVVTEIISAIGIVWGLWIIVSGVMNGTTNVGTMIFLIATFTGLGSSISNLLSDFAQMLERNLYVTDIIKVFNTKPIIKISNNPIKVDYTNPPSIEFRNVSFKYPGAKDFVLKNISFSVMPGEKVGLVGMNGSGKTTLVRLLLRIHDVNEGEILINGVDMKKISLEKWWANISVLFQDFTTYKFPVKEAIACGDSSIPLDMDRVKYSAKTSTASDFIENWKNKYDEQIGVEFDGEEPSKGERQKLAIAKSIYRQAKVLILDEPTASVDATSASRIFDNLENMSESQTAILISHNFSTIRKANKIILLSNGQIAEMGKHDELISLNGQYANSFNKQKEGFE